MSLEIYQKGFLRGLENGKKSGVISERTRILEAIDEQIRLTEDCPLYEGEERFWLLSAYRQVRRLVGGEVD